MHHYRYQFDLITGIIPYANTLENNIKLDGVKMQYQAIQDKPEDKLPVWFVRWAIAMLV